MTVLLGLCQTYVLDVHPFNPRIAMSAGYDGKTIVWDVSPPFIWLCRVSLIYSLIDYFFLFHLDMGRKTYTDI